MPFPPLCQAPRLAAFLLSALVVLAAAGCQSTPHANHPVTRIPGDSASPVSNEQASNPRDVHPAQSETIDEPPATARFPTPQRTPQPSPPSAILPTPEGTWISLTSWCRSQNLPVPRKLGGSNLAMELEAPKSLVRLTLGSYEAKWNGTEFWLGFQPRVHSGDMLVHRLDLEKHLRPLLMPRKELFPVSRIVVIDPGHGGDNAGTKSITAPAFEKQYALDWAKRLAPMMAANGWQVFLTRTNDIALSPSNRVAFATAMKADLFLSLHFNSVPGHPEQHGFETYALTPQGMPSHVTRERDEPVAIKLPGNNHDEENFIAAIRVQQSLVQTIGGTDRGARRARFMGVLRGQNCPAILIEAGYLSSPSESRSIARPDYRQKLAEAVARAFP